MLEEWSTEKYAKLTKGRRSAAELVEARAYFDYMKMRNKLILDSRVIATAEERSTSDATIDAIYDAMVLRTNLKGESLLKLARVTCEMGGLGWNTECDDILIFYSA